MTTQTLLVSVSESFRALGLTRFNDACSYIHQLPYGRNEHVEDPLCVIHDGRGTCSTKHALLSHLAKETNQKGWQLHLGIFRMDAETMPEIAPVLKNYRIDWLPEAHVFMRQQGQIRDFTFAGRDSDAWTRHVLWECAISPEQLIKYKRYLHQSWLRQHRADIGPYPADALWNIRQECIVALQHMYGG